MRDAFQHLSDTFITCIKTDRPGVRGARAAQGQAFSFRALREIASSLPCCESASAGYPHKAKGPAFPPALSVILFRTGDYSAASAAGENRNECAAFEAFVKFHIAFRRCKDRVVFTHADVFTWPPFRAALADNDVAWDDNFAAIFSSRQDGVRRCRARYGRNHLLFYVPCYPLLISQRRIRSPV